MDSAKDNDWNPRGHVHMDQLEDLTHEVNAAGNYACYISFTTEHSIENGRQVSLSAKGTTVHNNNNEKPLQNQLYFYYFTIYIVIN